MPFKYRWESPHTTPDDLVNVGLVNSGDEFETEEPFIHPYAVPLDEKTAKKSKE